MLLPCHNAKLMLLPLSSPGHFQIQKLWALVIRNFTREGVILQALVYFPIGSDTEKLKYTGDHLKYSATSIK